MPEPPDRPRRTEGRALHWFRSDLRLRDNTGLAAAAAGAREVALLFVLDERLLRGEALGPPRLRFLLDSLARLGASLEARGQRLLFARGRPEQLILAMLRDAQIERITWNRDYGPFAARRDSAVRSAASALGVAVEEHKDRVVFESGEIRTRTGDPFRIYTPFRNAWWERWHADPPCLPGPLRLPPPIPGLHSEASPGGSEFGVADDETALPTAGESAAARRLAAFVGGPLAHYARDRDRPDLDGTSRLSPYLRVGAISIRSCVPRFVLLWLSARSCSPVFFTPLIQTARSTLCEISSARRA
jgi:deoxyribodipyrimidine photo-lyase